MFEFCDVSSLGSCEASCTAWAEVVLSPHANAYKALIKRTWPVAAIGDAMVNWKDRMRVLSNGAPALGEAVGISDLLSAYEFHLQISFFRKEDVNKPFGEARLKAPLPMTSPATLYEFVRRKKRHIGFFYDLRFSETQFPGSGLKLVANTQLIVTRRRCGSVAVLHTLISTYFGRQAEDHPDDGSYAFYAPSFNQDLYTRGFEPTSVAPTGKLTIATQVLSGGDWKIRAVNLELSSQGNHGEPLGDFTLCDLKMMIGEAGWV